MAKTKLVKYNDSLITFNSKYVRPREGAPSSPYPLDGLKGRWTFDNVLTDSSGEGNDFSLTLGATVYDTGKIGNALKLSNGDSFTATGASLLAALNGAFSVSFWYKWSYGSTGTITRLLYCDGGSPTHGFTADCNYNGVADNQMNFGSQRGGVGYGVAAGNTLNVINTWHHAGIAWSSSTNKFRAFWNGSYSAESNVSGSITATYFKIVKDGTVLGNIWIDSLYVYNRHLSDSEFAQLYNGGSGI